MISQIGQVRLIGLISLLVTIANAEHRAALVIDNHAYKHTPLKLEPLDMAPVMQKLESYGFQTQVWQNTDSNKLKYGVRDYPWTTPVAGTHLLYYRGQVSPGNDRKSLLLMDINAQAGRGTNLNDLLKNLSTKGGSARNLIVLDVPKKPNVDIEVPDGCTLLYGNVDAALKTLSKTHSQAISPPEKFVQGSKVGDEWVNAQGMVFCWIPPGKFTMGSPESEKGRFPDETQREVDIKEGFWLSKYEFIMAHRKSNAHRSAVGKHKLHPLNMVSQSKDIVTRTVRPITKEEHAKGRLPTDWEYAIPSEEQWEYAARAGSKTTYYFGNELAQLPKHANFADKAMYDSKDIYSNHAHRTLNDGIPKLAKVGQFAPNPWGLHDMHGNVSEWTDSAVIKGGSWLSTPQNLRSAYRHKLGDRDQRNYVGVRLAIRKVSPNPKKK